MSFVRDILLGRIAVGWLVVTGAASLLAFLGLDAKTSPAFLIALIIFLTSTTVGFLMQSYVLYEKAKLPVRIRSIVLGEHYYQGQMVIILDKSNWIEAGQVLVLVVNADEVQTPLALLRVDTFTTEKYPQCTLIAALNPGDTNLGEYLSDKARWKSITALSEIKERYLQGVANG